MNARESAELRDTVARAELERLGVLLPIRPHDAAAAARSWRERRYRRCVYCGEPIRNKRGLKTYGLACVKHRDLPALDPAYPGARA